MSHVFDSFSNVKQIRLQALLSHHQRSFFLKQVRKKIEPTARLYVENERAWHSDLNGMSLSLYSSCRRGDSKRIKDTKKTRKALSINRKEQSLYEPQGRKQPAQGLHGSALVPLSLYYGFQLSIVMVFGVGCPPVYVLL